jgi:EAL domain-containing protein (putative c-di-GMP-specific phosphodiesterase class I)
VNDLLFGVPPRQLVFEIVESAVIQDPEGAKRLFTTLQNAGVRVALDDFGTGFSNLERLRDYPVDIVKIDRLFITNTDDITRNTAILQGLVEMSKTLGFEIIAEGIETEAQLEKVRAAGIKWVQGYLLGRPGPVDDWVERLK